MAFKTVALLLETHTCQTDLINNPIRYQMISNHMLTNLKDILLEAAN